MLDSHKSARPWWAYLVDLLLTVLFVLIGRISHGETLAETPVTAIPFVLALSLAWLVPSVHRKPLTVFPAGLTVWLSTALLGHLLRTAFGGGSALSFVMVTLCVLAVFFLGWRLVARFVLR